MPHAIQIPRLGWSMEQGTFVGWLKHTGETIKPGDALFTLEGEKAIQEIEAVDPGVLHFDPTYPAEGDVVAVGAVIGHLLAVGETAPPVLRSPVPPPVAPAERRTAVEVQSHATTVVQSARVPAASVQSGAGIRTAFSGPAASPAVRRLARQLGIDLSQIESAGRISEADVCRRYLQNRGEFLPSRSTQNSTEGPGMGLRSTAACASVPRRSHDLPAISPRAARAAAEFGIDWPRLVGSGANGRIRERDVLAAAGNPSVVASLQRATPSPDALTPSRTIRITPLRRTIADRMRASLQQTAPVTLTTEIDVTTIVAFRDQRKHAGDELIPSITDCFVKLVALVLPEHPMLNARWRDGGIDLFDEIHIGVAVDTDNGLLVPVVRDAHRHSVFEISRRTQELIEKARTRRLDSDELKGGTFTVTNLGSLGIDAFTPIINFPETAILGLGRIQTPPSCSANESLPDRSTMTLSLTFDHRVLDGAPAARFLRALVSFAANNSPALFESSNHR